MTCQDFDIAIGDAVDGTLGDTPARQLQEHLAACARCAAVDADLRAIRAAARALPVEAPAPRVWTAIAAAVESERLSGAAAATAGAGRGVFAGAAWWQPLAAAAMAVVVAGTLAAVGSRLEPLRDTSGGPIQAAAAASEPATADAVRHAEVEYLEAINGLEAITTADDTLDEETAGVLKANMTVIDQAIGESRAVLKVQPESELAIASLFEALRRKLSLLQDMVALINEMRQGDAEGAARIASGLNQ
jgi:hypothetical protein